MLVRLTLAPCGKPPTIRPTILKVDAGTSCTSWRSAAKFWNVITAPAGSARSKSWNDLICGMVKDKLAGNTLKSTSVSRICRPPIFKLIVSKNLVAAKSGNRLKNPENSPKRFTPILKVIPVFITGTICRLLTNRAKAETSPVPVRETTAMTSRDNAVIPETAVIDGTVPIESTAAGIPNRPARLMMLLKLSVVVVGTTAIAAPRFGKAGAAASIFVVAAKRITFAIVRPLTTAPAGIPKKIASNLVRATGLNRETLG